MSSVGPDPRRVLSDEQTALSLAGNLLIRAEQPALRAVVFVLALAEQLEREDLDAVIADVWPQVAADHLTTDSAAADLPGVIVGRFRWGITSPLAEALRARLKSEDPDTYTLVYQRLAAGEKTRLENHELSAHEHWYRLARFAYYMAPLDIRESSARFAEAFDDAPPDVMTAARMMLTDLVGAQEAEFRSGDPRVLHFFSGFRAYVSNNSPVARREFDLVLRSDREDSYRAIALHLRAKTNTDQRSARVQRWLRESVDLSLHLGLLTNNVMSRNSYAYSLIAAWRAARGSNDDLLNAAIRQAEEAVDAARTADGKSLVGWSLYTLGTARWLRLMGSADEYASVPADRRAEAGEIRTLLYESLQHADAADDLSSVLLSLNKLALTDWALGDRRRSIESLQQARDRLASDYAIEAQVTRLRQTTARCLRHSRDTGDQADLRGLLHRFREWERTLALDHPVVSLSGPHQ